MNLHSSDPEKNDKFYINKVFEVVIRVGVVLVLAIWCLSIIRPFIVPLVWGVIIAVAMYPGFTKLSRGLGGRHKLAAAICVVFLLLVIIGPSALLTRTLVNGAIAIAKDLLDGALSIPPPPESLGAWPIVGETLESFWRLASINLAEALKPFGSQLKSLGGSLLSIGAGILFALLKFTFAILIAGVLMVRAESGRTAAESIAMRLADRQGHGYVDLARTTVRSVARGILGVALIQSILAGLGFLAIGVPGAGLLALICLFLSVVQLGPGLVVIGTIVYVFSVHETTPAILYAVWGIFVSLIDNFLKPVLLGRGARTPMIVIFMGAVGGFLASGIIGLFVGAVILSLGYELFRAWLKDKKTGMAES